MRQIETNQSALFQSTIQSSYEISLYDWQLSSIVLIRPSKITYYMESDKFNSALVCPTTKQSEFESRQLLGYYFPQLWLKQILNIFIENKLPVYYA